MSTSPTNTAETSSQTTAAASEPPPAFPRSAGLSQPAIEDPRPTFSIREAATVLGKSLRALERSLLGKWGNKLPDGWAARKIATASGMEWRIIPPPGFRVRPIAADGDSAKTAPANDRLQGESSSLLPAPPSWSLQDEACHQPAVIIDRTDEIERLLRELVNVQKQLSEERRLHLEDLRLLSQLQGSMRLLDLKATAAESLKEELKAAQGEFRELKQQHLALLAMPWWKRLFLKTQAGKML